MSLTRPEVLRLLADGKRVRITSLTGGVEEFKHGSQNSRLQLHCYFDSNTWEEIPPPKMVPLGLEDIDLHRDSIRRQYELTEFAPTGKQESAVLLGGSWVLFSDLRAFYERSIDGGKTWMACEKEEA